MMIIPSLKDQQYLQEHIFSSFTNIVMVDNINELIIRIEEALGVGEFLSTEGSNIILIAMNQSIPSITFFPLIPNTDPTKINTNCYTILRSWMVYGVRIPKDHTKIDINTISIRDSCIQYTVEVQLIYVQHKSPDELLTHGSIPLTIVTSLLSSNDQHHGTEAYVRFYDRLQRDVLRTGRKWRRIRDRKEQQETVQSTE